MFSFSLGLPFLLLNLGIDGKVHLLTGHALVQALHVGRSRLEVAFGSQQHACEFVRRGDGEGRGRGSGEWAVVGKERSRPPPTSQRSS